MGRKSVAYVLERIEGGFNSKRGEEGGRRRWSATAIARRSSNNSFQADNGRLISVCLCFFFWAGFGSSPWRRRHPFPSSILQRINDGDGWRLHGGEDPEFFTLPGKFFFWFITCGPSRRQVFYWAPRRLLIKDFCTYFFKLWI